MLASQKSLADVVDGLPTLLRVRYQAPLFISKANEVLGEMERSDLDYMRAESALLVRDGVTEYPLPAGVRKILGVYAVPRKSHRRQWRIAPDMDFPYAFNVRNNKIRLDSLPPFTADLDIEGATAWASTEKVADAAELAVADDTLIGYLCRVSHATGLVEDRIISSNSEAGFWANLNGELDEATVVADPFLITPNYLWLLHNRYLTRFVYDADAEAPFGMEALLPFSVDLETIFEYGLKAKLFEQTDKKSPEASDWKNRYDEALAKMTIDEQVVGGDNPRNQGRSIPSMFS